MKPRIQRPLSLVFLSLAWIATPAWSQQVAQAIEDDLPLLSSDYSTASELPRVRWRSLPPAPIGQFDNMVLDAERDRALIFSGGQIHELRLGVPNARWETLPATGRIWPPRNSATVILDPVRDRLIVFGGYPGAEGIALNDLNTFRLSPPYAWATLAADGARPPIRHAHAAVYDPPRDRMLVFGGAGETPLGDLWELTLAGRPTWRLLLDCRPFDPPAPYRPAARFNAAMVVDPAHDRVFLHGGSVANWTADLYALSLGTPPAWKQVIVPSPRPAPIIGHTLVYDTIYGRVILFGTDDLGSMRKLWELTTGDNPAWRPFPSAPMVAYPANYHSAIFEPRRAWMITSGRSSPSQIDALMIGVRVGSAWLSTRDDDAIERSRGLLGAVIHGSSGLKVTDIDPTTVKVDAASIARRGNGELMWSLRDANHDRVLDFVFSVRNSELQPGLTHELGFETTLGRFFYSALSNGVAAQRAEAVRVSSGPAAHGTTLLDLRIACPPGGHLDFEYTLPGKGGARLDLFDVAGRRLQSVDLTGDGTTGRLSLEDHLALAPGVYLARLQQGPNRIVRRFALTRTGQH